VNTAKNEVDCTLTLSSQHHTDATLTMDYLTGLWYLPRLARRSSCAPPPWLVSDRNTAPREQLRGLRAHETVISTAAGGVGRVGSRELLQPPFTDPRQVSWG
jgi:hypothetical protein